MDERKKYIKKKTGITLIALIITIIVLLILAGVSISMVVGDNGVLTQAQNSATRTMIVTSKEDLEMAWTSCMTELMGNTNKTKEELFNKDYLNNILNSGKIVNEFNYIDKGITRVTYKVNNSDNVINYAISENGEIIDIDSVDFIDITEDMIGAYVDLGINYTNITGYKKEEVSENYTGKGWRILDVDENGIVKVVSAGCPLRFKYISEQENALEILHNLYVDELITTGENYYYVNSGFSNTNLKQVFNSSDYIDVSKSIHALFSDDYNGGSSYGTEIENVYNKLTGNNKVITQLFNSSSGTNDFSTNNVKAQALTNNITNYKFMDDLFCNGASYWLANKSYNSLKIFFINTSGYLYSDTNSIMGIRPVVYLKAGTKISKTTGSFDGISSGNALLLKVNN